jgi:hypothetical protein
MADVHVSLPAYSMFSNTPVYEVKGDIVFGLLRDPVIASPTDQLYVVTQAGEKRLDLVSSLFYGTSHLWWVLALVNNLVDPLVGVSVGTELRIPTKQRLADEGILT